MSKQTPPETKLPRDKVLEIANRYATKALTTGSVPYIQHFIGAIEEALEAAREHSTAVIREQLRDVERTMPIDPTATLRKNYVKIPLKPEAPDRRGPVCHACGKRGPHICTPFIVDTEGP